jgi:hypothetical protein
MSYFKCRVIDLLLEIRERLNMTVDQPTFDAALATFVTAYGTLSSDLTTIKTNAATMDAALIKFIADYNAKNGVDLTSELASITAMSGQVASDTADAVADANDLASNLGNITTADPNA